MKLYRIWGFGGDQKWSLQPGGLYLEVIYITFLDGRNLKGSLKTGGFYSQVVFKTGWTVHGY